MVKHRRSCGSVPLERQLYGHPLAGLLWERQFEEALMELGQEKVPNWECQPGHRKQGLFLSENAAGVKKWLEESGISVSCARN